MSQQEEGGGDSKHLANFSLNFKFYDRLSPRLSHKMFVCDSTLRDTPDSCSPSKVGVRELERERVLTWPCGGSFPSLPVRARESQGSSEPEAAVSHSEGFHSCAGPELCVIQKLPKTMAIPLGKISFSVSVLLSITVLCRNTAAGNPGEAKKRKKESSQGSFSRLWSACI